MLRRSFVRTAGLVLGGGIFVPRFERWFRPLIVRPAFERGGEVVYWDVAIVPHPAPGVLLISDADLSQVLKRVYAEFAEQGFPAMTPLMARVTAIDARTKTITLDPLAGVSADDYVFRAHRPARRDFLRGLRRRV